MQINMKMCDYMLWYKIENFYEKAKAFTKLRNQERKFEQFYKY